MSEKIKKTLKIIVFFSIGILLFYLAYRGQDFNVMWQEVKNVRWTWIILTIILCVIGHYSRALRWSLLLEPLGYKPKSINLFSSIMIMYLSNMAIPRSGEFIRCGIINRYEKIPLAASLGTVVTERIVDMLVFIILTIIVIVFQGGVITDFLSKNADIAERLQSIEHYIPYIILFGILFLGLCFFVFRLVVKRNIFSIGDKILSVFQRFKDGVFTILKMKTKVQFLLHTFFINFVYYFETILTFKAFECTEHISAVDSLSLFVLSTYGVVVPSPGGMGTWHYLMIELLALYGIAKDPCGRAYAFVTHGAQDVLFLVGGGLLLLLLPIINKNVEKNIH